ncbi:hypothetical protein [Flavihumibacter profundi]|uniref:hypothetical protein n=1 Tax=Flavihumibacter profundi TaxID=2716883 RepID=UPI001CC6A764|nr:hypothetical protein [Flavihumibacter profundi]MBZ5859440.1 hypothetical protein [Flavihumibacter profundi]
MTRVKIREKILHVPSTKEIFYCLSSMPHWVSHLIQQEPDKPYNEMLSRVLKDNFYTDSADRRTIKSMAADLKIDAPKFTKWISSAYYDLLDLNFENPKLFQSTGIPVTLYFAYFDSRAEIRSSVYAVPREYEKFSFNFVKAKVGTDTFWVKRIQHSIDAEGYELCIWLSGTILNRYREILLEKALFHKRIGWMETYQKSEWEIDEELRYWFKG